jgi:hypothetical protein
MHARLRLTGHTRLRADGRVIVAGGQAVGGRVLASAEVWDARTDAWEALPRLAAARDRASAAAVGGAAFVFGGQDGARTLRSVEVYDAAAGKWRPGPDLAQRRRGLAAVPVHWPAGPCRTGATGT